MLNNEKLNERWITNPYLLAFGLQIRKSLF